MAKYPGFFFVLSRKELIGKAEYVKTKRLISLGERDIFIKRLNQDK